MQIWHARDTGCSAGLPVVTPEIGVEASGVLVAELRGRDAELARAPAPASEPDENRRGRCPDRHARHEPRQQVESLVVRRRQDLLAELGDERVLDLLLRPAFGDLVTDELALAD